LELGHMRSGGFEFRGAGFTELRGIHDYEAGLAR